MSINVYEKKINFYDAYFELEETTIQGQLKEAINLSLNTSIRYLVYNKFIKQMTEIEHHCYECKKQITIDVSRILKYNRELDIEQYLCDEHKKEHKISKNSVPFIRYETAFNYKLMQHLNQIS